MSKLVSPEELHQWLMTIPPAQLAKERYSVKADLAVISDTPLNRQKVDDLSHQLFALTAKYNLSVQKIMDATNMPHEAVLRLQSGNPFVKHRAFEIIKQFADDLEKTGQLSIPETKSPNKISKYASLLISDRLIETVMVYHIDQKTIVEQSGLPYNDVSRLFSENPFVAQKSLDILNAYLDQVDYWKGPKPDNVRTNTEN